MDKKSTIDILKKETVNIAIVGSRNFNNYETLVNFIKEKIELEEIDTVISGGARGADKLAEQFADRYNLSIRIFYPDWQKNGRAAGFIRNKDIIKNSDIVFAFWDGKSKGTLSSINIAKKLNKKLYIYQF